MSSYQVGDACYPTPSAAAMASASTVSGSFVSRGTTLYQVNVTGVTDTSITYRFTPAVVTGTVVNQTIPFTAQPCGLLVASDGVQVGWMIAAAWIGVYAIKWLARTIRGMSDDKENSYGNA